MRKHCWLWICLLLVTGLSAFAQEIPPRPSPPRLVNDMAGVLLRNEADDLERKLVAYHDSTSNEVAIVTIRTTGEYDISDVGLKILRDWGVGAKDRNNGVVIVAAIDDRRVRIETGDGLEGAIPDAIAGRIIDQLIKPNFREGHYYQGLDQAIAAIEKAAAGEYKGIPKKKRGGGGGSIFVLIIVAIILLSMINRRGGNGTSISRRGWGGWGGFPMGGGGWGSSGGGWGGGDSGGGGFGGFGGGTGSGGGASGSW